MARLTASRRRMIQQFGRTATLRRVTTGSPVDVSLRAAVSPAGGDAAQHGLEQSDFRVEILNDEIAAAAWPTPPAYGDQVQIDSAWRAVQNSVGVYDGATLIGWSLVVRGTP